jgi:glycosyltransferase involved in cell wall biosynthesis
VLTTTIVDLDRRPSARSSIDVVDGATVHYLATPLRYRWMGITPTLPLALARAHRPDAVHVFGFRDPVTTCTAAWCRIARVPYVFEPLGMFQPRLRKVLLKRALDATLYRGVARGAAAVVVASEREGNDVVACGVDPAQLSIPDTAPLILYVGRIAAGKGIEHLLEAAREIPEAHVVVAGPDDRHGVGAALQRAQSDKATSGRIHTLPVSEQPPRDLYPQADVFVLASAGESFGMVAAEAAAAGTPVVVSDRCGIAGFFEDGEALVVPYDGAAVIGAVRQVLGDDNLRERLALGGVVAARRMSWDSVAAAQEEIYRAAASRTAATKLSTEGS